MNPAAAPTFSYHLDQPDAWDEVPRLLAIRGWVFHRGGEPVSGIRARFDDHIVSGTFGHHRPDVAAAFPEAPDAHTGFQIQLQMRPGRFELVLEVRTTGQDWQPFHQASVSAPRWRLPFAWGGGTAAELLAGQLALGPQHAPRPITTETFPSMPPSGDQLPKLTVVTPSYNQATWLQETLQSVSSVFPTGVEHILMDGGSSDESPRILENHQAQLSHWQSAPDGGQADAIAQGFARSSGSPADVMAWINADDHYLPGALDFVRNYFAQHPHVDVVYGNRILIDEDGSEIGRWHLPTHDDRVLKLYDFVPQETLFWRRRIWDQVGGIDSTFQFAMDWDLLLRFQQAGARFVHIPRFLAAFRVHGDQKSAAQIGRVGQAEIDRLRTRAAGRPVEDQELLTSPVIESYLRSSARRAWFAQWGLRPRIT